jgi:lipopolysaccharide/colanic/teichoic acid biosynthesis glycosyltransferase
MAIPVHILLPVGAMGGKSFVEKVYGFDVLTHAANTATPLQLLIKRGTDLAGGLIGSLAAVLIILIVGPFIKIASPGPILFRQERIGLNGKHFHMLKLRSMDTDAEERKADLQDQNCVTDGRMFKMEFDPRIIGNRILPDGTKKTGIGEFIRRTSLDEFPQFFNVLKGDMSLVGTRPPTLDEWERYELHHRARLSTRPGMTGMWQISGRSEITDFEEVVRLDTQYINNWSIGLDIRILLKTVKIVLCGRGAR